MACAARFDVRRMLLHVRVDRPLQPKLSVLKDDGVFILCNAIHRTVEGPVKDDAGGLTFEARIVFAGEAGRLFLPEFGELCATVGLRTRTAAASSIASTATCRPAACRRLSLLIQRTEPHEPAAGSARVG